jgi:hypothetical protein
MPLRPKREEEEEEEEKMEMEERTHQLSKVI